MNGHGAISLECSVVRINPDPGPTFSPKTEKLSNGLLRSVRSSLTGTFIARNRVSQRVYSRVYSGWIEAHKPLKFIQKK
jgi:hypothetical protein